jgi:hypothetical protein
MIVIIIINCGGLRVNVGPERYLHLTFGRLGFLHLHSVCWM